MALTFPTSGTTAGKALTVVAGSSATGSADINGGDLTLSSGGGDGTGTSKIDFKTQSSGTDGAASKMQLSGAGVLTLSAGGDGALRFSAASSMKILDDNSASLVIEEADNAYLTFDTTNSSEGIIANKTTLRRIVRSGRWGAIPWLWSTWRGRSVYIE